MSRLEWGLGSQLMSSLPNYKHGPLALFSQWILNKVIDMVP